MDYHTLTAMAAAYLEAAAFCNRPSDEATPGGFANTREFSHKAKLYANDTCYKFRTKAGKLLDGLSAVEAGQWLYFTQHGHGTGFWDSNLGDVGDKLTELSHTIPEVEVFVNDDNCYDIE